MANSRKKTQRKHRRPTTAQASAKAGANYQLLYALLGVIALAVIGYFAYSYFAKGNEVTTASGLKYVDQVIGTGASPTLGKKVKVHYTGTLENGEKFDSSVERGQPIEFAIGTGGVIKGWDEGIMSMKVGGKRKLIIPSQLGYGAAGRPPSIPGGATLLFDVELVEAQ